MHELTLPTMTCGGCARSVTATVKELDPEAQLDIDLPTKVVKVQSTLPREVITEALSEAGFAPAA